MSLRIACVALVALFACTPAQDAPAPGADDVSTPPAAPTFEDPDVARIYATMSERQGSTDTWNRVRFLAFDWIVRLDDGEVRRSHEWDKYEGRARVAWTAEGSETVAILDQMNPHQGRAWTDGVAVEGDGLEAALERAYRIHINDAYWLVMPFKWSDPGVRTRYLGPETGEDGRSYDVVELTFESVGVTPDNKYHAYVSTETGLMERWAHHSTREAEPSYAEWAGYTQVGPLLLALDKGRIQFENVRVVDSEIPTGAFAAPD